MYILTAILIWTVLLKFAYFQVRISAIGKLPAVFIEFALLVLVGIAMLKVGVCEPTEPPFSAPILFKILAFHWLLMSHGDLHMFC